MKKSSELFCPDDKLEWEDLGGGVSRKFLGWDKQIMMVKVKFEKGAIGSPHQHFHSQTSYCVSGEFRFDIGSETRIITAGDGVYIPPDMLHGAECISEGILIDVFSPLREDFLDGSKINYFGKKE